MRIAFNIDDNITGSLVEAVRNDLDRPELDDEQIVDRYLKKYIQRTINDYMEVSSSLNLRKELKNINQKFIEMDISRSMIETTIRDLQTQVGYVPVEIV